MCEHSLPKISTNFEKEAVFLQQMDLLIFLSSVTFTMTPEDVTCQKHFMKVNAHGQRSSKQKNSHVIFH